MFERFGDLPLHVLVIHAAVVVLPVSALAAVAFALVPRWRWLLRRPVLLLGLGSAVLAYVAKESGEAFVAAVPDLGQLVQEHQDRGDLLFWYSLVFAVVSVAAFLLLGAPGENTTRPKPLELLTSAALVVIAVLVIWQTIRTGDSGAKAVWDGRLPAK